MVEIFWIFVKYFIQHCFICRPSESTVSVDAGIELRTVATLALAVRSDSLTTRLDFMPNSARSHLMRVIDGTEKSKTEIQT